MNHENGAAMLAALRPGALVTLRAADGRTLTGRAEYNAGAWMARTSPNKLREPVTAANIIRVQS